MKTPNYFLLLVFLLGFAFSIQAKTIDQKDAEKAAVNFFYERTNQFQDAVNYTDIIISNIFVQDIEGTPAFYAFDFQNGGFVIISAEDATYPIIGYAYEGKFPVNMESNPNYKSFIMDYAAQVAYARENNVEADDFAQNAWDHLLMSAAGQLNTNRDGSRNIEPLLTSLWNQDYPYNYYSPKDAGGSGGRCYAGCVATAMSIVMHYWRYPEMGEGSHSYYASGYGTQTANFGATEYQWDAMQNDIDNANPFACALNQYHAAVAVDMNFGPDGSGSHSELVDDAMQDYFRYGSAVYMEKNSYPSSTWISIMQDELDLGRPIYYSGFTTDWAGHAFVCDGYEDTDFHFNFGWSGSGNGYYSLYSVNTYHVDQRMVKNLYPTENYPYYASGNKVVSHRSGSITDGSGPLENYQDNTNASWLLQPQSASDSINNVSITFSQFDLEANDFVTVYDGVDASATVLGTFTGTDIPDDMTSTGNQLFVTFVSDASGNGTGFYFEFNSTAPTFCDNMTNFSGNTESFTDGSDAFNYGNSTSCKWLIEPAYATEITLYITDFSTEEDADFMTIYDGTTEIAKLSGDQTPDPIVATSGSMFITFTSNSCQTSAGWEAYYEVGNVGVKETLGFDDLKIFPNPAQDVLNISFNNALAGEVNIEIISITGMLVYQENTSADANVFEKSIDISDFSEGVYFVRISNNNSTVNKRVVVK
jgi:Peptidase C10 family/Secretion system C-terminal sorting domain/CUB domain/Spi protease inhibitor